MLSRRSFLIAGIGGALAVPPATANANFKHPVHRHVAKIEARLQVWRDHVATQHDVLLNSAEHHIAAWRAANSALPNTPQASLLEGVNRLINSRIVYKSDYAVHKTSDFWATLDDALIHGGDCEDYALAKATSLAFHGWPETHLHLVIGILHRGPKSEAHAVLVVERDDGTFWSLDNLSDRIVLAEQMSMQPLYGVDAEGVWLFTRPTRSG
ncbi:MAG: transglutaminase-like cysteine peptidase [Alphaproteobacteria bacterium]|nr:transglutaminase-like cysteine peptidase [Alphaproteobacteria bacterium]